MSAANLPRPSSLPKKRYKFNDLFGGVHLGKVTNIEYGKIDFKNDIIETVTSKLASTYLTSKAVTSKLASTYLTSTVKTGSNRVPVGWGVVGPPADDDRGCYDPV